ncbi:MAG: 50S ribosomal protein L30 [SAR86 cluster bacterium]|jgi:large subunit ribosomal protein L30|nr:50S ribosomal protein L30 [SAR86 cluster bacterium]|tara:strand:+ start:724 stop:915 length:192 start_codon:yes stop_codon:yes gene_type:complete
MSKSSKKIKIKLVKSRFGRIKKHKASLSGLGLRKINQVIELDATPENLGMVNQVRYLLEVEEV